jgi:hypothetical protein
VSSDRQDDLKQWLCDRSGTALSTDMYAIGSVSGDKILGVVGFTGYNGASIHMHVAGDPRWLTKTVLYAVFDYAFNVCKVNVIVAITGEKKAIRLAGRVGFKCDMVVDGAHSDGPLWFMTMRQGECRFLNWKRQ